MHTVHLPNVGFNFNISLHPAVLRRFIVSRPSNLIIDDTGKQFFLKTGALDFKADYRSIGSDLNSILSYQFLLSRKSFFSFLIILAKRQKLLFTEYFAHLMH